MKLKGNEEFVAKSLQIYFNKISKQVKYTEGEDPPDIYLHIDGNKIAVEITDIDENVLQGRKTIDRGYLTFIDNLEKKFKSLVAKDKKLFIIFFHNYNKVSKISKKFESYLQSILEKEDYEINCPIEDTINNIGFKINIHNMPKNGNKKIAGSVASFEGKVKKSREINIVMNQISDCHLSSKTFNIINNRIMDKNKKCTHIKKPIWLALYDNYFNKFTTFIDNEHFDFYNEIVAEINDFGIFDKVLIVFENGDILDIHT